MLWTVALLPASIALLKEPAIDYRVLAAVAAFAIVSMVLVTAWPAHVAMRASGLSSLGGTMGLTRRARPSSALLVGSQVALGFLLLTAGGLAVRSVAEAYRNDTGFRRERLLLLEVFVTESSGRYGPIEKLRSVPDVLRQVPAVDRIAVSAISPYFSRRVNQWTRVKPQGWATAPDGVVSRTVSAEFFEVLGIQLVDGRWPEPGEWTADRPVALVSETAARMLWPNGTALGRTLVPASPQEEPASHTVIGIVADARFVGLDVDPLGDIYLPDPLAETGRYGAFFHVRTRGPAADALPVILSALGGRGLRIDTASTHEDALFASVKHRILPAWLFGTLGLGALAILAAGVLGLLAMSAAQRTRELGIRIALGATPGRVIRMLVGEQLAAVAAGLVLGALVSAWGVRLLEAHLYRVRPYDPSVWTMVAVTLTAVAVIGSLIPSTRASRVDPVQALRTE
jgi:hypothetical protein